MTDEPPADQAPDAPPPRLFGLAFCVAMAFAILCVVAGYLFAHLAPRLFPVRPPPAPAHAEGQGASFRKEIVLRASAPRAALAQPVERRIRNA